MQTLTQNNITIGINVSMSKEYLSAEEVIERVEGNYDKILPALKSGKLNPVLINGTNMFRLAEVEAIKELK